MRCVGGVLLVSALAWANKPAIHYDRPPSVRFQLSPEVVEHRDDSGATPADRHWFSVAGKDGKDARLNSAGALMKWVVGIANEEEALELADFVGQNASDLGLACRPVAHRVSTPALGRSEWVPVHPADRLLLPMPARYDAVEKQLVTGTWSLDPHLFIVTRAGAEQKFTLSRPVLCDDGKRLALSTETYWPGGFKQVLGKLDAKVEPLPPRDEEVRRTSEATATGLRAKADRLEQVEIAFETEGWQPLRSADRLVMVRGEETKELPSLDGGEMIHVRNHPELFSFLKFLAGETPRFGRAGCRPMVPSEGEGVAARQSYVWEPKRHRFVVHRLQRCKVGNRNETFESEELVTEAGAYVFKLLGAPIDVPPPKAPKPGKGAPLDVWR